MIWFKFGFDGTGSGFSSLSSSIQNLKSIEVFRFRYRGLSDFQGRIQSKFQPRGFLLVFINYIVI